MPDVDTADRAPGRVRRGLSGSLSREILALCGVIFLADVSTGIVAPTFSLYAASLGVSLALLGLLNTLGGLSQLLLSLPAGIASDRIGRVRLLIAGMLAFVVAMLGFAAAGGPRLLAAGRLLYGFGTVATFQIGAAHLGDISAEGRRSVAFGAYATAMGIGFTLGPLLGGQLSERFGAPAAFVVSAVLAALGALLAWRLLTDRVQTGRARQAARPALLAGLGYTLRRHDLLLVSFGSLLMSVTFNGAVVTFFPIYGDTLHLTAAAIGSLFAIRALVSTLGRLPNSLVSRRIGSTTVMLGALVLDMAVMFALAHSAGRTVLTVLLAGEGLAFGAYLVSGQTYVAEHTRIEARGAAVGVYSSASSLGGTLAPLALGLVAARLGIAAVFSVTGWTLLVGAALFAAGIAWLRRNSSMQIEMSERSGGAQ
ncbi:MAG TPA: MFS transporter [Thermomicrobiaceae bacterium]|nr:MFS transporter [Thermomicrobiaceae bacterium]